MDADVTLHQKLLREFGYALTPTSAILDFGCGDGVMVKAYRAAGLQAVGADVTLSGESPWLYQIPVPNYRLPFADATFDFVYSNSVLEHVEDLDAALAEIQRVLKPGGVSLHLFPPAAKPIEPHVHVPLGGLVRLRWWLNAWAFLGVRNRFQHGVSWRETAARNYSYLHNKVFYRPKREIRRLSTRRFRRVLFADREMIRHSYGKARYLDRFGLLMAPLYGTCHQRCLLFER